MHELTDEGDLLYSSDVPDSYYNYLAPNGELTEAHYVKAETTLGALHRNPAIYLTPRCSAPTRTVRDNYELWASDAWMIASVSSLADKVATSQSEVVTVGVEARSEYVRVFKRAYSGDDPNDPYSELDEGYPNALEQSFSNNPSGYKKYYLLARLNEAAVGVANLFTRGDYAAVYGVGVEPQYRNRGIGLDLMKECATLSRDDGASTIFLQTEANSRVEKWYNQQGYETIFVAEYHILCYST